MLAAEGAPQAQGQAEEGQQLGLQGLGVGGSGRQQVHVEVPVPQVAVGHGGDGQALQASEELRQAAAGHHDVLAHLLRVALLEEGAGEAAQGPDVVPLATLGGHLQAVREGPQEVQEVRQEGLGAAAPLIELQDGQGLAGEAPGRFGAVGPELRQHRRVEELKGAGQEARCAQAPR